MRRVILLAAVSLSLGPQDTQWSLALLSYLATMSAGVQFIYVVVKEEVLHK